MSAVLDRHEGRRSGSQRGDRQSCGLCNVGDMFQHVGEETHAAGRDMRAPVSATKRDRQDTGERGRGEARDTLAAHVRLSSQPTTPRAARCYPTALCCRCCAFWHALCGLITRLAVTSQLGTQVRSGRHSGTQVRSGLRTGTQVGSGLHSGTQVRSGLRTETWARHAQVARLERRSSWLGRSGHLLASGAAGSCWLGCSGHLLASVHITHTHRHATRGV